MLFFFIEPLGLLIIVTPFIFIIKNIYLLKFSALVKGSSNVFFVCSNAIVVKSEFDLLLC